MANRVTNRDMAAMLFNIATLLRDRQDSPYRIRAYERGARALLARRDQIADARSGRARPVWGVGPKREAQWSQPSLFGEGFRDGGLFPDFAEETRRRMAA